MTIFHNCIPSNSTISHPDRCVNDLNSTVKSNESLISTSQTAPIGDMNNMDQSHISMKTRLLVCFCCHANICDQFYFVVDGLPWHSGCLKCNACQETLTTATSCFCRNNKIWCKKDYDREFRCQKCMQLLKPSDLVMRTGGTFSQPYHVGCFRCNQCNTLLLVGDSYGVSHGQLMCRQDFIKHTLTNSKPMTNSETAPQLFDMISKESHGFPDNPLTALCQLSMNDYIRSKLNDPEPANHIMNHDKDVNVGIKFEEAGGISDVIMKSEYKEIDLNNNNNNNNTENIEQCKAQIKTDKISHSPSSNYDDKMMMEEGIDDVSDIGTKEYIDQASLNDVSTVNTDDEEGSDDLDETKLSISTNNTGNNISQNSSKSVMGGNKKSFNANSRQKRIRTSFKHQQLRTMKAYFAMNHNPDSKDLRQLSQKTGLSKRVLQVWFQNARAKFRRSLCRQSGVICHPNSNQMISGVFEDTLINIDKNGNYQSKPKMNSFSDLSNNLLNHSIPTSHRLCTIPELNYHQTISTCSSNLLQSLPNLPENYIPPSQLPPPQNKPFIPTSNGFYNNANLINLPPQLPPNPNSPSLFSIDLNNLTAISEFARDNNKNSSSVDSNSINNNNFHLAELGMPQNSKITSS